MNPYPFALFHRVKVNDGTLISIDTYRFTTRFNRVYFIEVERYEQNIYFAKFYLRIHKHLKSRFQIVINDGDGFRILSTCIALAKQLSDNNNIASFGYIGINRIDEDITNTQRFKIYTLLATKYFDPKKYDHVKDESHSIYFLLNKSNVDLTIELVSERLNEYYVLD